jgi:diguanylate cyclase (GGDEF)-like protein
MASKDDLGLLPQVVEFVRELDAAVEAHQDWSRRILRCAVLGASPGADVLEDSAHRLCHFGLWFTENRGHFEKLDTRKTERIEMAHQDMHDAVRSLCMDLLERNRGTSADLERYERSQSELLVLLAELKTLHLASSGHQDVLTGLPSRHGLEAEFTQFRKACLRNRMQCYVGIIDVDHFKRVNDTYGHPIGDVALRHLASTLRGVVRASEPLFRFGGEEFLVLLQCESVDEASAASQRIVEMVRATPATTPQGELLDLTVTLGLAQVSADEGIAEAIERADKALYVGKRAGRDRYIVSATD